MCAHLFFSLLVFFLGENQRCGAGQDGDARRVRWTFGDHGSVAGKD